MEWDWSPSTAIILPGMCSNFSMYFICFSRFKQNLKMSIRFCLFLPILNGRFKVYVCLAFILHHSFMFISISFSCPMFNYCPTKMLKALDPLWQYGLPTDRRNQHLYHQSHLLFPPDLATVNSVGRISTVICLQEFEPRVEHCECFNLTTWPQPVWLRSNKNINVWN